VTLTGWPVQTFVLGETVFKDGIINDNHRGGEIPFDHTRGGYWATVEGRR
jgi:dihydroorotase